MTLNPFSRKYCNPINVVLALAVVGIVSCGLTESKTPDLWADAAAQCVQLPTPESLYCSTAVSLAAEACRQAKAPECSEQPDETCEEAVRLHKLLCRSGES